MLETLTNILGGFVNTLTPFNIVLIIFGVIIGIIFGALPGLNATMAVVLFLPITFGMDIYPAFSLLLGLYIGGISGGLITAILINIPGQPASIATTYDGAPMAKKGYGEKAIRVGVICSFCATLLSIFLLMCIAPLLAKLALQFSAIEYFALALFSLTLISGLSGDNILVGLVACTIGICLSFVGYDPVDSSIRYTFGIGALNAGIPMTSLVIGMFAFGELLRNASNRKGMLLADKLKDNDIKDKAAQRFTWKEAKGQLRNFFQASAIGVGIGILPGFGAGVSNILAYSSVKKASKYPEKFGTGIIDGVVASESSNNAAIGGAMIPLLTMGIPGDTITLVLLGAFTMQGLQAGPMLFIKQTNLVYMIYACMIIATLVMLVCMLFGVKAFTKILKVPLQYILVPIVVICMVGAFQERTIMMDLVMCLIGAVIALIMDKLKIPNAPLTLGYILGSMMETNLRRGMMLTNYSFGAFFKRPVALVIFILTFAFVGYNIYSSIRRKKRAKA